MDYKVKKVLCLDLDGTVRRSKSGSTFIKGPDDIELMPGIEDKIMMYKNAGYLVFGVTNQAGIAHGFKTEELMNQELDATRELFKRDVFEGIFYASNDENGKVFPYNYRSLLRKPGYGMLACIEEGCFEQDIIVDWDNSLMVGDRSEDKECATNAKVKYLDISEFLTYEKIQV